MHIPDTLKSILDQLIKNGARPILVGGFVRDHFLGIDSKDIDIEVYGLDTLENLASILEEFGSVNFVGKSFGVLKLKVDRDEFDFSFPRTENKSGIGHTGFDVKVDGSMSYAEGARRRDFTVNSIGYDYKDKSFIDPFLGISDLENKTLKHIDEDTFIEDPLRVYRGIQFCARFELDLDEDTRKLFYKMIDEDEFKTLPKERVFEEYKKLLLKSKKPSIGLKLIDEFKIDIIPIELQNKIDNLVKIKTDDEKINLVLFFYYLENIFKKISADIKLQRDMESLKQFKIPKIYENKIVSLNNEQEILKEKYFMMKNMPDPLLMGKDLIEAGMKPNPQFKNILDEIYQKQLDGKIKSKKEALKLLKNYF